jgi:hypothetical protein
VFFGAIIAFWFLSGAGEGPGIFGGFATSTANRNASSSLAYQAPPEERYSDPDLAYISNEVRTLRGEVKEAKLWGTRSPYAETVHIRGGNTATDDEDEEYLTLTNSGSAAVAITGWTLESQVTGKRARIPNGTERVRADSEAPIILLSGESATVVSGESPVGTSFKENRCTGYFEQYQDFYPGLAHSCPYPTEEMEEYGDIPLDDDRCYDFVATLASCEVARAEASSAHISARCEAFVRKDLTYSGCVENHALDMDFESRTWRIFLDEDDDLWRSEREIVRLLDGEGKTVAVYQY